MARLPEDVALEEAMSDSVAICEVLKHADLSAPAGARAAMVELAEAVEHVRDAGVSLMAAQIGKYMHDDATADGLAQAVLLGRFEDIDGD